MADSILDTVHCDPFRYILIPADPVDPIQELVFSGKESEFQNQLKSHFTVRFFASTPSHSDTLTVTHSRSDTLKG